MKINNNISAVITNSQLLRTEDTLADSMERLSSGLRINHASDDPSGMAISNKMQAQIDSLDQASRNASDGTSVLETADGATNEIESMLQRMRELAVQAANGTNSLSDKQAAQKEVSSLRDEIDRVSKTTEFNTKSLLTGALDTRVYADNVSRVSISEAVSAGTYKFDINQAAKQAKITGTNVLDKTSTAPYIDDTTAGDVSVNGNIIHLTSQMTEQQVYEALRSGAEVGEATLSASGDPISFTSTQYGADATLNVTASNVNLANLLGIGTSNAAIGTNAKITLDPSSSFGNQATVAYEGNKVTISDMGGFQMSMLLDEGVTTTTDPVSLSVTDIGPMSLQIGANQGQQMNVRIPSMSAESLYLDEVDVTTVNGASRAIVNFDNAIAKVSEVRSSLGAYTNRLDYSTSSLDATNENMTAALSRIEDVDMAKEMTEYTRVNVLAQASTSALKQANELPQMALQLLQ